MAEMSRGDVMRRLDGASKDFLKRLANGPLGDGRPNALARTFAGLVPTGADEIPDTGDSGATTSIVAHLGGAECDEPRTDA
jgi:hypothetical protein